MSEGMGELPDDISFLGILPGGGGSELQPWISRPNTGLKRHAYANVWLTLRTSILVCLRPLCDVS